jgi:hypothetical protein
VLFARAVVLPTGSPQGKERSATASPRRPRSSVPLAAPGGHLSARRAPLLVLVKSQQQLVHPSVVWRLRRRSSALCHRLAPPPVAPPLLAACAAPWPSDGHPTAPTAPSLLVKPCPGQTDMFRSPPSNLDSVDQIQHLSLSRTFLLKRP